VNVSPVAGSDRPTHSYGDWSSDVCASDLDTDVDGDALHVTNLGTPAHGTASVIATGPDAGKVLYTPALNYNGADSFTYTANDGKIGRASCRERANTADAADDAHTAASDDT